MGEILMKKILSIIIALFCLFTAAELFFPTYSASAATEIYIPRWKAPSKNNKYYYKNNFFEQCGYGMPNCTAYAWGRAYEILGKKPDLCPNGAEKWYDYNKKNKIYPYGKTPKLGAVACWKTNEGWGHVAVVEEINGKNVTFSESRYGGENFLTLTFDPTTDKVYGSSYVFQGYIYIGNFKQHTHDYVLTGQTANHPHYNKYKCTVCGLQYTDKQSSNYVKDCAKCASLVRPKKTAGFITTAQTMTTVKVSWKKNPNATAYRLWTSLDGKKWKQVGEVNAKTTSATLKGLKGNTKYIIRLAAMNDTLRGAYSDVTVTTAKKPDKPTNFKVKSKTSTAVTVSWTKSPDATGYQVWYSTDGKKWTSFQKLEAKYTSATLKGLKRGKTYKIRIAAMNGSVKSAYSDVSVKI